VSAQEQTEYAIVAAHRHSSNHRAELMASETCGCFYCLRIFHPREVQEWVDEVDGVGTTALCPHCGIDSVVGAQSGYPITKEFLAAMNRHWFAAA
jgi:hypothetical protein